MSEIRRRYTRFFREIGIGDVALVGGKNASLGEMYRALTGQGIRVPNGFAITAQAYRDALTAANAWPLLHRVLDDLSATDMSALRVKAEAARQIVYEAGIPAEMQAEILEAYRSLQSEYGTQMSVAVRSSATAEDLPNASFAGQQDTYLNVTGEKALLEACRRCFASLFTERAIHYRVDQGFDHFGVALSIGIMKMVRSDLAASGVMFSLDTESGFRDTVLISASYGLGENIVQGNVDPDEFWVFKPTLARGIRQVLRRNMGSKKLKLTYDSQTSPVDGSTTRNSDTTADEQQRFCLSDQEVVRLAEQAVIIEKWFSQHAGHPVPMDIEWAKDGLDGELYIVQARPETVASRKATHLIEQYRLQGSGPIRLSGRAIGNRIGCGIAHVIESSRKMREFKPGEVLITDNTTPDWEPVMKLASAIITNRGGRTCHAAIVARELGIPAIVGAEQATSILKSGEELTVACTGGEMALVYSGRIPFTADAIDVRNLPETNTKIMLILGNPEMAFQYSFLPTAGIGLARMEFIVTEYVKAHPMALLQPERVTDTGEREALLQLARHYARPADFFVERLAEGIATLAAAFYPRPVILRMSDFKTNEYASLLGGSWFEPKESNPMLGFRGALRYSHPAYKQGFGLECAAVRRVREQMGLDNLIIMIPFCRRVAEAEKTIQTLSEFGLHRGEGGLEVYVMCEIPNNVLQIDAFARHFDGFSIGSNDLTQLTLGVDRDSALVAADFDERDEGVQELLRLAVEGCRRNRRHSGICGQAPSDYPEVAEHLVRAGIDSISLNPDSVVPTIRRVAAIEAAMQAERVPAMAVS